jgi:hypothetical protein
MANNVKSVHYRAHGEKSPYTYKHINTRTGKHDPVWDVRVKVPNTDVIMVDGKREAIRFLNMYESIFVKEQVAQGAPTLEAERKELAGTGHREVDEIIFDKGELWVDPTTRKNLADYLAKCNYNGDNPNRIKSRGILFNLVDSQVIAQKQLDAEFVMFNAKKLIFELKDDSVKLRRLGDLILGDSSAMEDTEVQTSLLNIAKLEPSTANPTSGASRILAAYKQLGSDISESINEAERLGIIQIQPSKVIWNDGSEIVTYRAGSKGKIKLTEYLEKNQEILDLLKSSVSEKMEEAAAEKVAQ